MQTVVSQQPGVHIELRYDAGCKWCGMGEFGHAKVAFRHGFVTLNMPPYHDT
jgi:hypothetical protein